MTNRAISLLLTATLATQVVILARMFTKPDLPKPTSSVQPVREPQPATRLDLSGMPIRGNTNATVVLVEFSDYECPFCARHASGVAKQIDEEFVNTGKLRLAFANNPLEAHTNSQKLATAAICAGRQNRYWEMHALLFEEQPRSNGSILGLASKLGIDPSIFETCLGQDSSKPRLANDMRIANDLDLKGTPSFAVGIIESENTLLVTNLILGAQPFTVFRPILESAITDNPTRR